MEVLAESSVELLKSVGLFGLTDLSVFRRGNSGFELRPKPETVREHFEMLRKYGFSEADVKKMARKAPHITCFAAERSLKFLRHLEDDLGYPHERVLRMLVTHPGIFCLTTDKVDEKIDNLVAFGFSRLGAINALGKCAVIFTAATARVNRMLNFLTERQNGKKNSVCAIVAKFPSVLCYGIERAGESLDILEALGIDAVHGAPRLCSSPKLIRGRCMVLLGRGAVITEHAPFISNDAFQDQTRLKREQVLERDPGHAAFMEMFGRAKKKSA